MCTHHPGSGGVLGFLQDSITPVKTRPTPGLQVDVEATVEVLTNDSDAENVKPVSLYF